MVLVLVLDQVKKAFGDDALVIYVEATADKEVGGWGGRAGSCPTAGHPPSSMNE